MKLLLFGVVALACFLSGGLCQSDSDDDPELDENYQGEVYYSEEEEEPYVDPR